MLLRRPEKSPQPSGPHIRGDVPTTWPREWTSPVTYVTERTGGILGQQWVKTAESNNAEQTWSPRWKVTEDMLHLHTGSVAAITCRGYGSVTCPKGLAGEWKVCVIHLRLITHQEVRGSKSTASYVSQLLQYFPTGGDRSCQVWCGILTGKILSYNNNYRNHIITLGGTYGNRTVSRSPHRRR